MNQALEPTRVLTEIALACLAAGAKVQGAVVDAAFAVIGSIRAIRAEGPGR